MDILPAIDLRDGKVVRLAQGDYDRQTTYSDDPLSVAGQFAAAGFRWVHMVDLDAAKTGRLTNLHIAAEVARQTGLRVEFGGGIRSDEAVEQAVEAGLDRLVIGSAALRDWRWFESLLARPEMPGRLALGLDAREGKVAAAGWTEQTDIAAIDLARRVTGSGLGAIVYTDIARDGMLTGVNLDQTAAMIDATDVPVVASGGVGSIDDLAGCQGIGCAGVIIGRAYYEGRIDLAEAARFDG